MLIYLLLIIEDENDKQKLTRIFEEYYPFMLKTAMYIVRNESDAETAVSDALLYVAENISSVDDSNPKMLRQYLFKISENSAKSLLRKKAREKSNLESDMDCFAPSEIDVSLIVENNETREQLIRLLLKIPQDYRDVIYCKFVLGLSLKETATYLNRKYSTVRTQMKRGLALCKKSGEGIK